MGCATSKEPKNAPKLNLLPHEYQHLENLHSELSDSTRGCTYESLADHWDRPHHQYMANFVLEYYFGRDRRGSALSFERFAELYAKLAKGSADEKCAVLCAVFSPVEDSPCVAVEAVRVFVLAVVTSYMECEMEIRQGASWTDRGCRFGRSSLQRLAESMTYQLEGEEIGFLSEAELESWIATWPERFGVFLYKVLLRMFDFDTSKWPDAVQVEPSLIPTCRTVLTDLEFPSVLELVDIVHINSLLPRNLRRFWRLCFSTQLHGFSFESFFSEIKNMGPTVLVVKDSWNSVFGVFASSKWVESESFFGDWWTFLFTLRPRMRVYRSSGHDNNFQLLNPETGLGIGGSVGYHALCIQPDLRHGICNHRNLTFADYEPLTDNDVFDIVSLEVWVVGRGHVHRTRRML